MPLILKEQIGASVSICIWQINETEAFFLDQLQLKEADLNSILQLKLPSRRLEKLACRVALSQCINNSEVNISYNSFGAPQIEKGFISFSHAKEIVAVAYSPNHPIGIDIEKVNSKILKLKHKFVGSKEVNYFDMENPEQITQIWCTKEALFKWYEKGEVDFRKDLHIAPDFQTATILKGENKMNLTLKRIKIDPYICVVVY
ncbi:MAG: 4'-phosphopantetheinyl transferase superfamily protein [Bacteroidales bacterium]|jgi:4'-phosphopantetheinyl transferase|nr:4'-phosphopantetheinyl transferase superfamily protein [Bacteroidales bacterium]HHT51816.1 4'-phosphopantetheinyl transferase superfamily protein [Bacteroidales bacterium]